MMMSTIFKKSRYLTLFFFILALAFFLRFYKLGDVPHGMTWDEAAIGYNGYAIWKTHRDEWLIRMPISFWSFGDYKAPLAIYINSFFTKVFGMNLWAVRLPFALAGVGTVAGIMLFTREVVGKVFKAGNSVLSATQASLVAGLLTTLSPWHLHFSRVGFESGLAMFFFIWGLFFLTRFVYSEKKSGKITNFLLPMAVFLLVASMYTYHSAKLVVPILFLAVIVWRWRVFFKRKTVSLISGVFGLLLSAPLVYDSFWGRGLERLNTTLLGSERGLSLVTIILKNITAHLDLRFLVMGETTTLRHGDGSWGVLLVTTFLLVIVGITGLVFQRKKRSASSLAKIGVFLVFLGVLPAAIGQEVPHANRSLLALPGFILLATAGFDFLSSSIKKLSLNRKTKGSHGENNILLKSVMGSLVLIHLILFVAYQQNYYGEFARESADDFKDGYLEAFAYTIPFEKKVDKILFTDDYGQPYIYALFARKTDPIWYRGGSLNIYEFNPKITNGDLLRKNTLVVASGDDELLPERADYVVYGSDLKPRFKIFLTEP